MGIDFDNVENLTADQILSEEAIDTSTQRKIWCAAP